MSPQPSAHRVPPFHLPLWPLLTALIAACGPGDPPDEEFSDEALVVATIDQFLIRASGNTPSSAFEMVSDGYLHQGRDRESFRLWLDNLAEGADAFYLYGLALTVDSDAGTAQVEYRLEVEHCEADTDSAASSDDTASEPICRTVFACHSSDRGRCDWLTHLQKEGDVWRIRGDDRPFGFQLHLATDETGTRVTGTLQDPGRMVTSLDLAFTETGAPVVMEQQSSSVWAVTQGEVPAAIAAGAPLPWAVDADIETADGPSRETVRFLSVMDAFATHLMPSGEVLPPITFFWTGADAITAGVEINVYDDAANRMWTSSRTFSSSLSYGGPALVPGTTYSYEIHAFDLYGNRSIARGAFTPYDEADVSPVPATIVPAVGAASLNTDVTITGENFLDGARVLFNAQECVNVVVVSGFTITCTTPALAAGVYNVTVVNPSGRSGMIEAGFTVTP